MKGQDFVQGMESHPIGKHFLQQVYVPMTCVSGSLILLKHLLLHVSIIEPAKRVHISLEAFSG
jgi:hypothetical protein